MIGAWRAAGVLGAAEAHAAAVIARGDPAADRSVELAVALAVRAPLHGDVCVDLAGAREHIVGSLTADSDDDSFARESLEALEWPPLDGWLRSLRASSVVREVTAHDPVAVLDTHPVVLHGTLLYTQRQWVDECIVAASLRARADASRPPPIAPAAAQLLDVLLPPIDADSGRTNVQHVAAGVAVASRLAVVVGGPGTGKTHTVARMLAVLFADAADRGSSLRVGLAAPTGKAAARLREAIAAAAEALPDDLAASLRSVPAVTIHRLLGSFGGSRTRFRHDTANPLPYDVVVIDEMSMVALPLMARLVEAIPVEARLVLVGDPDQLESIEVGSVLADIVAAAASPGSLLSDRVVRLTRPRRQQVGSPIAALADAIRDGRVDDVVEQLARVTFIDHDDPLTLSDAGGVRSIVASTLSTVVEAARDNRPNDALDTLSTVRVVCAHRRGTHGVERWNRAIEGWLFDPLPRTRFYPGQVLLATRNDLRMRIANGDTGVVVADPVGLRAGFIAADGLRLVSPAQLDSIETSYATTIHKSQGSEYDTVVVVLAPATSPILRRELLYTAVTRASRQLVVVGSREAVMVAVRTPSQRVTGLADALAN